MGSDKALLYCIKEGLIYCSNVKLVVFVNLDSYEENGLMECLPINVQVLAFADFISNSVCQWVDNLKLPFCVPRGSMRRINHLIVVAENEYDKMELLGGLAQSSCLIYCDDIRVASGISLKLGQNYVVPLIFEHIVKILKENKSCIVARERFRGADFSDEITRYIHYDVPENASAYECRIARLHGCDDKEIDSVLLVEKQDVSRIEALIEQVSTSN